MIKKLHKVLFENPHHSLTRKSKFYSHWHNHPMHKACHWTIFILVVFIVGSFFYNYSLTLGEELKPEKPMSAAMEAASWRVEAKNIQNNQTKELLNTLAVYKKADEASKPALLERMRKLAGERAVAVRDIAKQSPGTLLDVAMPEKLRAQLPAEVANLIEKETTREGTLEHLHIHMDNFKKLPSIDTISLIDSKTREKVPLIFGESSARVPSFSGTKVKVKGVELNIGGKPSLIVGESKYDNKVLGASLPVTKKIAVILYNFQDDPSQQFTAGAIKQVVFGSSYPSVKHYYQKASFGKLNITGHLSSGGDVFGWVTIPYNKSEGCDQYYSQRSTWKTSAEQMAGAQGFNASNYTNVIYMFPWPSGCSTSGSTTGTPATSQIPVFSSTSSTANDNFKPIVHELGHNFGRGHANSYGCSDANGNPITLSPIYERCSIVEYGDSYDVMGTSTRHMSNYNKGVQDGANGGWLDSSNVRTLTSNDTDGVYTLYPSTLPSSGTQVLRVPLSPAVTYAYGVGLSPFYYLEFRKPTAPPGDDYYDYEPNPTSNPYYNGVTVRLGQDFDITRSIGMATSSLLLDMNPNTGSSTSDAPLMAGQTFTDPSGWPKITVQSVTADFATVRVQMGQSTSGTQTLPWKLETLAMDGINRSEKVDIPTQEAINFIEQRSRFRFSHLVTESSKTHGYTKYDCGAGPQKCVVVNYSDVDSSVINSLPTADSYLLLWNLNGNTPLQAGSTWGVANGIPKGGINRPYATVPVDIWWYNNGPYEGFSSRAAQILTHELINTINAKLEVAPYNCASLTGTPGDPASKYEGDRLAKLTDACYAKLASTGSPPPPPVCTSANPTFSISPQAVSTNPAGTASFTFSITNNDSSSCASTTYTITPTLPSGWTQTPIGFNETLPPGQSITKTFLVTTSAQSTSGSYSVSQRALLQIGGLVVGQASATVTIASDTTPPSVTIITPPDGQAYSGTIATLTMSMSASDASPITSKKLYLDNNLIKTCTDSGAICSIDVDYNTISVGSHTLRVEATDSAGNTGTKTHTFTKSATTPPPPPPDTTAPVVTISSPASGASFTGGTITFSATATDASTITSRKMYLDNVLIYTCPTPASGTCSTSINIDSLSVGSHSVKADATDSAGNIGSATHNITKTVIPPPSANLPVVTITSPTENQLFTSGTQFITISAKATSGNPLASIKFYLNNSFLDSCPNPPYQTCTTQLYYTFASITKGANQIRADATDTAGNTGTKTQTFFKEIITTTPPPTTPPPDTTPPVVTITSPTNNSSFEEGTITFSATATDASTITSRKMYLDNVLIYTCPTPGSGTCSTSINIDSLSVGSHSVKADATDSAGNTGTKTHTFTKSATTPPPPPPDTTAPVVTISSPASGASFTGGTITFSATATDASTITSRKMYLDNVLIYTCPTPGSGTCSTTINIDSLSAGSHSVKADATDSAGNVGTKTHTFSKTSTGTGPAPIVTINSPENNYTFPSSTQFITISAKATSSTSIANIKLYLNNNFLDSCTNPGNQTCTIELNYNYFLVVKGANQIRADATDSAGNVGSKTHTFIK